MQPIYLDHAATTSINPEVLDVIVDVYKRVIGNPSSIHSFGRQARKIIDEARRSIGRYIGAHSREIVFTSGGTEGDNMAIIGTALANRKAGRHIITTKVEHHGVLQACRYLETHGFSVDYLNVDRTGRLAIDELKRKLRDDTILVSVMYGNNEVGTIQPIREIAHLLAPSRTLFHTDVVQAFGTVDIDVKDTPIDLLSMAGHKINGPKGIGFLYIRDGVKVEPLTYGGDQQRKHRAGTLDVPAVAGLAKAVELVSGHLDERIGHCLKVRGALLDALNTAHADYRINGSPDHYLPQVLNLYFPGVPVEALLTRLDLDGVAVSSGSACSAGSLEPSHVLTAMFGDEAPQTRSSIRISFGTTTTVQEAAEAGRLIARDTRELAQFEKAGDRQ
ncbi:MAG: cysteine desulfurase [Sporolactobacillus sp.]|jgi:cysteine desulfurase|nr:cysteine desulfurase [Sporolactobacillus sp.]